MVQNALLDDEVQAWAQPLLSPGIKLVGLVDACNSSTGFRNLPTGASEARGLGAIGLHIPESAVSALASPDCVAPGIAEPLDPATVVQPCDQLWLAFQIGSSRVLDISALYFNAGLSIAPLWPIHGLSISRTIGDKSKPGSRMAQIHPPPTKISSSGEANWLSNRLNPETSLSFSSKPAPLLMMRQTVRIRPASICRVWPEHFRPHPTFHFSRRQLRGVSCDEGAKRRKSQSPTLDSAIFLATGSDETLKGSLAQLNRQAEAAI